MIESCIKEMEKQIVGEKLKNLQHDMDRIFEDKLNERIVQGAGQAKIKAEAIARKWGDKVRLLCFVLFVFFQENKRFVTNLRLMLWYR